MIMPVIQWEALNMKQKLTTRRIVCAGLMAALTVAGSAIRIVLPLDIGGNASFHLGNIMCALSGVLLGPWLGGFAAGLGSALYDLFNPVFVADLCLTFLMKGLYGVITGLVVRAMGRHGTVYGRVLLGTAAGAVSYAAAYLAKSYFYTGLLMKGLTPEAAALAVAGKLPATIFNAAVAIICAPILAVAIQKALERSHISLE